MIASSIQLARRRIIANAPLLRRQRGLVSNVRPSPVPHFRSGRVDLVQRTYHGGNTSPRSPTSYSSFGRRMENSTAYSTKSSNFLPSSNTTTPKQARLMEQLGIAPNSSTIKQFRKPRRKNPIRRYPDRRHKMDVLKVNAIHIGQTIDLAKVKDYVFSDSITNLFGKNSLVLELPQPTIAHSHASGVENGAQTSSQGEHYPGPKYLAVFRFGSVVGINLCPDEFQSYLGRIELFVHNPVVKGSERREDFGIMLAPNSMKHDVTPYHSNSQVNNMMIMANSGPVPTVNGDYCVVSDLDLKGISVISNILAQTTALDTYNDTVDSMLNKFAEMNTAVQTSGTLQSRDKKFLFKTFAQNNAIFIDLISKIRLKDRSDTAWNNSKYENIHYGLKEEFEIEDRFDQVEYKLNLIQQNSKFFLEVLESEKSNSLEWIIVGLILCECVLMCVEMSGFGEQLFASLGSYVPQWPR